MNTEESNQPQDNQDKKPEVYALKQGQQGWKVSRRDFLAASAVAAGALAAAGCAPATPEPTLTPTSSSTPSPTATSTSTPSPTATQTPTQAPTARPTIEPGLCQNPIAHKDYINFLKISTDGAYMVSGCKGERTIKIWSLPEVYLLKTINIADDLTDLALSPDGSKMALSNGAYGIHIYSIPDGDFLFNISHSSNAMCLDFDPSGEFLGAGFSDRSWVVFSAGEGQEVKSFEKQQNYLDRLTFSPDGKFIAAATAESMIGLWAFPEGEMVNMIDNQNRVNEIAFSRDGRYLFTYDFDDRIITRALPGFDTIDKKDSRGDLVVSPDGTLLLFEGMDNSIEIWDIASNRLIKAVTGHAGSVGSIAISPDNSILASGNDTGSLYLWSLPAGTLFSCPVDLAITPADVEGVTYEGTDSFGRTVTYTLPCGAPIPEGAVCVCNCVGGSVCSCVGYSECSCVGHVVESSSHYWYPN